MNLGTRTWRRIGPWEILLAAAVVVVVVIRIRLLTTPLERDEGEYAYGGALNRLAADATAFVHRDKLAGLQATSSWSTYASTEQIAVGTSWLSWLAANVFDDAEGAYQNYIDPTLVDWRRAYYGENLERLVAVKNAYDPENVFSFPQSIPLSLD